MPNSVNVGLAPNDARGDPLREAFIKINNRFVGLDSSVSNIAASFTVRPWVTGQSYGPGTVGSTTDTRDVVNVGGLWYIATVDHVAGATFAGDLSAGRWLNTDPVQLRADLDSVDAGKGADLIRTTLPTSPAVPVTVGDKLARMPYFEDFGGSPSNTAVQNLAAFDEFVAYLAANDVPGYVGAGEFLFSDELAITQSGVRIIGAGSKKSVFPTAAEGRGTCFKYAGPISALKAVVRFAPTAASNANQYGCGLIGVALDADARAGIGLALGSTNAGEYSDVAAYGYTNLGLILYAVNTASVTYTLGNKITGFRGVYGADGASGIVLIGPEGAGVNTGGRAAAFNLFQNCHITYKNGVSFFIQDGDDNTFIECRSSRDTAGTGYSVLFTASQEKNGAAYANRFYGFIGAATPTGTAAEIRSIGDGTAKPQANYIQYAAVDGNPVVYVEPGTSLYYYNMGGYTLSSHQPYSVQPPTKFTAYAYTGGAAPVTAESQTSLTNTGSYPQQISHITSGVPAFGFGVGRVSLLHNASNWETIAAREVHYWTDPVAGSEDATYSHIIKGAGVEVEVCRMEGAGTVRFPAIGTTASSANAHIDSANLNSLLRSTSSARYKRDVEDMGEEYALNLLRARPVFYRSAIETDNQAHGHWGLIAEELAAVDPRLVQYGHPDADWHTREDGTRVLKAGASLVPDGVAYDRMSAVLLKIVQIQQRRLDDLDALVAALSTQR
jgi:hypothetical protein